MFKVNLPVEVDVPSISGGRAMSVLMPPSIVGGYDRSIGHPFF